MERQTRLELATSSLARKRSTTELLPHFDMLAPLPAIGGKLLPHVPHSIENPKARQSHEYA